MVGSILVCSDHHCADMYLLQHASAIGTQNAQNILVDGLSNLAYTQDRLSRCNAGCDLSRFRPEFR